MCCNVWLHDGPFRMIIDKFSQDHFSLPSPQQLTRVEIIGTFRSTFDVHSWLSLPHQKSKYRSLRAFHHNTTFHPCMLYHYSSQNHSLYNIFNLQESGTDQASDSHQSPWDGVTASSTGVGWLGWRSAACSAAWSSAADCSSAETTSLYLCWCRGLCNVLSAGFVVCECAGGVCCWWIDYTSHWKKERMLAIDLVK